MPQERKTPEDFGDFPEEKTASTTPTDAWPPPANAPKVTEPPGFFGALSESLTGFQTAAEFQKVLLPFSGFTPPLIGTKEGEELRNQAYEETAMFLKGAGKGVFELWKEISFPEFSGTEAVREFSGINDIKKGLIAGKEKNPQAFAGYVTGGLLKLFPIVSQGLEALGVLKIPTAAERAAEINRLRSVDLPSGERLPATRRMIDPSGELGLTEPVVSRMLGGKKLRETHQRAFGEGDQILRHIFGRNAAEAINNPVELPSNISDAIDASSKVVENHAKGLYDNIEAAVAESGERIDWSPVATAAHRILQDEEARTIAANPMLNPKLEMLLKKLEGQARPAGFVPSRPAGVTDVTDYRPAERVARDAAAAAAVPGARNPALDYYLTAFDARGQARDLAYATRGRNRMWGERIKNELGVAIRESLARAAETTGQPEWSGLAKSFTRANELYSQSKALGDVAKVFKPTKNILTGTREEIQAGVRGAKVMPQVLKYEALEKALNKLDESWEALPGREKAPSRLARAFPKKVDRETLQALAHELARVEKGGQLSGMLARVGMVRMAGHPMAVAVGIAFGVTRDPLTGIAAGLGGIAALHFGTYIFADLMSNPNTAKVALQYLRSIPGSGRQAMLAVRLNKLFDHYREKPKLTVDDFGDFPEETVATPEAATPTYQPPTPPPEAPKVVTQPPAAPRTYRVTGPKGEDRGQGTLTPEDVQGLKQRGYLVEVVQ